MAWLERWGGGRKKNINEEVEAGHHFENLHDENEDRAGEKVDLATGKPIKNTGPAETADTQLRVVETDGKSEDALGEMPEEDDPAAKWLREQEKNQKKAA